MLSSLGLGTNPPPALTPVPDANTQARPAYIYTQLHCIDCGRHIADHGVLIPLSGYADPHVSFTPTYHDPRAATTTSSTTPANANVPAPRPMANDPGPVSSVSPGHDLVTWYPDVFTAESPPALTLGRRRGGLEKLLRPAGVAVMKDATVPDVFVQEGCRSHAEPEQPQLGGDWRVLESWECSPSSSARED